MRFRSRRGGVVVVVAEKEEYRVGRATFMVEEECDCDILEVELGGRGGAGWRLEQLGYEEVYIEVGIGLAPKFDFVGLNVNRP